MQDFLNVQSLEHQFQTAGTTVAEHLSAAKYPKGTQLIYPDRAICSHDSGNLIEKLMKYGFTFIPNVEDLQRTIEEAVTQVRNTFSDLIKYRDPFGENGDFCSRYSAGPQWHQDQMGWLRRGVGFLGSFEPKNVKGGNFQIWPLKQDNTIYQIPFNRGDNLVVFIDDRHRGTQRSKINPSQPAHHYYLRRSLTLL
jgi:hypothetical protein